MVSTFPQFSDGNVEIYLSSNSSDKLVLHSYVLALHSTWFKASLSERWNEGSEQPGSGNGTNRWTYELRFDKDSAFGLLTRRAAPGQPRPTDTEFIDSALDVSGRLNKAKTLHKDRLATINAHKQLFGTTYHVRSAISQESFQGSKAIIRLLETAEAYGAEDVIRTPIESHMSLHRDDILMQCAINPLGMMSLALATQSHWIFSETAVCLIGKDDHTFFYSSKALGDLKVVPLLQKKRNEFKDRLVVADFALYRIAGDTSTEFGMVALSYFHAWLTEQLQMGHGSSCSRHNYAQMYRTIKISALAASGPASEEKVQTWLDKYYDCYDAADYLEDVKDIFVKAASVIGPLLKDNSSQKDNDPDDADRPLRFMGVSREEMPWVSKG